MKFSSYDGVRYSCADDGVYELANRTTSFDYITCRVKNSVIQGYSSINIYGDNTYTDFFFKSPVTGTLAPILERVEMMEPIATTISGTLKLLIPFLVSLIAFWKAWQVFSRVLHHA